MTDEPEIMPVNKMMNDIISITNLNNVPAMFLASGYVTKHWRLDMNIVTPKKTHKKEWGGKSYESRNLVNQKDTHLFYRYGIRLSDYERMLEEQGGVCAICKKPETKQQRYNGILKARSLCVDHDHKTGKVRGLLCHACNRWILSIFDNEELMDKVTDYLGIRVARNE